MGEEKLSEKPNQPFPGSELFTEGQVGLVKDALNFAYWFDKPQNDRVRKRSDAYIIAVTARALDQNINGEEVMRLIQTESPRETLPQITYAYLSTRGQTQAK